jgi:hypothetical protein
MQEGRLLGWTRHIEIHALRRRAGSSSHSAQLPVHNVLRHATQQSSVLAFSFAPSAPKRLPARVYGNRGQPLLVHAHMPRLSGCSPAACRLLPGHASQQSRPAHPMCCSTGRCHSAPRRGHMDRHGAQWAARHQMVMAALASSLSWSAGWRWWRQSQWHWCQSQILSCAPAQHQELPGCSLELSQGSARWWSPATTASGRLPGSWSFDRRSLAGRTCCSGLR